MRAASPIFIGHARLAVTTLYTGIYRFRWPQMFSFSYSLGLFAAAAYMHTIRALFLLASLSFQAKLQ